MRIAAFVVIAAVLLHSPAMMLVARGNSCCCAGSGGACPLKQRAAHSCSDGANCGMRSATPHAIALPPIAVDVAVIPEDVRTPRASAHELTWTGVARHAIARATNPEAPPPEHA
jgi:hypothetical protein